MPTLADLTPSPEARILAAVLALLRGDTFLAGAFKKIQLLETASRESFSNYGVLDMAVQPFAVKFEDHPSQRSTIKFAVMISAFLAMEETDEDSTLIGLNLGSYLRKLLWGLAVPDLVDPSVPNTFATTEFRHLAPLLGLNGNTRILSYVATFETDVDPLLGDFTG